MTCIERQKYGPETLTYSSAMLARTPCNTHSQRPGTEVARARLQIMWFNCRDHLMDKLYITVRPPPPAHTHIIARNHWCWGIYVGFVQHVLVY